MSRAPLLACSALLGFLALLALALGRAPWERNPETAGRTPEMGRPAPETVSPPTGWSETADTSTASNSVEGIDVALHGQRVDTLEAPGLPEHLDSVDAPVYNLPQETP